MVLPSDATDDGAADFVCYRKEPAPCASAKSTGAGAGGARRELAARVGSVAPASGT